MLACAVLFWGTNKQQSIDKALCLPGIFTSVFSTTAMLLYQKTMALIETLFTVIVKGNTQNRSSEILRLWNKWTAFNCRLLFFYVAAFVVWMRTVSCDYGRNTHFHVRPVVVKTVTFWLYEHFPHVSVVLCEKISTIIMFQWRYDSLKAKLKSTHENVHLKLHVCTLYFLVIVDRRHWVVFVCVCEVEEGFLLCVRE